MRETIYNSDLTGDAPFIECLVGDLHVFIINPEREAAMEPWERAEMWNRMGKVVAGEPASRRQKAHEAEIIDIEALRARRIDARRAQRG